MRTRRWFRNNGGVLIIAMGTGMLISQVTMSDMPLEVKLFTGTCLLFVMGICITHLIKNTTKK